MTQKILAFSGAKQSGKSTACNIICGMETQSLGIVDDFNVGQNGELLVHEPGHPDNVYVLLNQFSNEHDTVAWFEENVFPYVKVYSFADELKLLCVNLLGLDYNLVYGTDVDKNTLTHLDWGNMPGILTPEAYELLNKRFKYDLCSYEDKLWIADDIGCVFHEPGPMTVRDVLQYVGTNIFRRMYSKVWVNSCINKILAEGSQFALICDARFEDEVQTVQEVGGKVIRLTRSPYAHLDKHGSETVLDNYQGFDWVLDNKNMTIDEAGKALYYKLREWGYLEYEIQFGENAPS